MSIALVGGTIITPFRVIENGVIVIQGTKIYELGKAKDVSIPHGCEVIDVSGRMISPGFVDLLVHGGAGRGFTDDAFDGFDAISDYFLQNGSTTILASLCAMPEAELLKNIRNLANYILGSPESNIKGIHMEGPYLNKEFKGAMNDEYLWKPTVASWKKMWEASKGLIKLMTTAPELPGVIDVMRAAANDGVVLSIGHSMATYDEIELAIDNGAAHVTHMFNAMKPLHHRQPGVALAAMLRDELKIELIADTYHVHPAIMEFLLKVKKAGGIILITDSIKPGGMHEGEEFEFANQKVRIKGGKAVLNDGTIAGSSLTLNKAVKNMIEHAGAKITEAIRMASLNGAKVLNLENRKGILAAGKDADIVVLDEEFNVEMTMLEGKIKYQRADAFLKPHQG
ncbi:MAG: N-acetylglucosamine-6-phosphate deacetylase [Candidatus Raymondbacteria bacterium RifOxyA12_full_50_37]|uniref:N-acetylglucosamine-6-phosphate deacetylase n=1 Tax=Candidatus Raymondbacteria bacterium RIFOXYD12_FULL_49_13 TaxID=1817890 RepID=A0A1F7F5Y9_UNCRA|nr:MAG: N-acetylglucosamine-6-phosphate deacetylase [Candidatus Raymondbacteria bacterium RifOxyA12_full_50_37]OGJ92091.1 MAG: N-acetylglucosamine-6-phosphate deacetylase [Candidatus Raymondbacteria bacterium RIFOXYA2_FULL_49_16]OGJ98448.1 MAG: N-acetylglucosamine-6-phosphate deacetylase [Candidatus Raymondbacteria bacterium RIFOXYC2_FULL_50_21]OGK01109.1 MAG: N-acetylglucosamine-6-phosphate deacetylase [Candidatus Raymondbacteria bacterium RifOxyB12_full_50_8]OGK02002.1 MAG: N-acetylglucosamin